MNRQRVSNWHSFDIIKGIFAYIPESKYRIPASIPRLHGALYGLTQRKKYKKFLKSYIFEQTYFPFSEEFQTDLVNLEMSGHLSNPNPDLEELELTKKIRNSFEKYTKSLFTKGEINILIKMTKDFLCELGIN